jgi:hypothetical protein
MYLPNLSNKMLNLQKSLLEWSVSKVVTVHVTKAYRRSGIVPSIILTSVLHEGERSHSRFGHLNTGTTE